MSADAVLQLLNLPLVLAMIGAAASLVYYAGKITAMMEDHERRLKELEDRATFRRRQDELDLG